MLTKKIFAISIFSMITLTNNIFNNYSYATTIKVDNKENNNIKWYSYNEGVKQAKLQNKKILIDFYTDWCGYCKKMDQSYKDEKVSKEINKNFICIKVNAESENLINYKGKEISESELAQELEVTSYPTTTFIDNESNYIDSISGYLDPLSLRVVTKFIGSNAYLKETPEDFVKNLDKNEI